MGKLNDALRLNLNLSLVWGWKLLTKLTSHAHICQKVGRDKASVICRYLNITNGTL